MQIVFKGIILSHHQCEKNRGSQREQAQSAVRNEHSHILLVALGAEKEQAHDKPGDPHANSMILKLVRPK